MKLDINGRVHDVDVDPATPCSGCCATRLA